MNLREGTRRLALLLGVAGAILGGFVSYFQLQSTMRESADHLRWTQLADSSVVEYARKGEFGITAQSAHGPWEKYQTPQEKLPPAKTYLDDNGNPIPAPGHFDPNAPYCLAAVKAPWEKFDPCEVDSGGIKTIHWTENREVASIETEDGQTVYPTPAPSASLYCLIALFPILGFFIPWGAVRAIGWVLAGFVAGSK